MGRRRSIRWGVRAAWVCLATVTAILGCERHAAAPPVEQVRQGWVQFRLGEFDAVAESFRQASAGAMPGTAEWRAAVFGEATTWHQRRPGEDRVRAAELYGAIVRAAPESDEAAWSRLAVARLLHLPPVDQAPDLQAVIDAYQQVIEHHPNHPAADEATVLQQLSRVCTRRPDDARAAAAALESFLQSRARSPMAGAAWGVLAACHEVLNDPDARLAAERRALALRQGDPSNPFHNASGWYWRIATLAELEVGDFRTARTYYRRFIEEYPNEARTFMAMKALERMDALEARLRADLAAGGEP